MRFFLATSPPNPSEFRQLLRDDLSGALVVFEGWVRASNHGRKVVRLEYEAYEPLAIQEGERILSEAVDRFGIRDAVCCHRTGSLPVGDLAVWVGVVSAHRAEAFEGCRYIIDELKVRVPIWKKEHYEDGETSWLEPCACCGHGK